MPRKKAGDVPSLRRHRPSGQGVVTLSDQDHYLGKWPAGQEQPPPAVRAASDEAIARWLAGGRMPLRDRPDRRTREQRRPASPHLPAGSTSPPTPSTPRPKA